MENKPLPASPRRWLESVETTAPRSEQHRTHEIAVLKLPPFSQVGSRGICIVLDDGVCERQPWHGMLRGLQNQKSDVLRAEQEAAWQHL